MRISRSVTALRTCLGHPFFFRLLSNAFSDFGSVGWKRKKKKKQKKNWKRSLELGGPVSHRNIRVSVKRRLGVGAGAGAGAGAGVGVAVNFLYFKKKFTESEKIKNLYKRVAHFELKKASPSQNSRELDPSISSKV